MFWSRFPHPRRFKGHPGALRPSSRWSGLLWALEYVRGVLGNAEGRVPVLNFSQLTPRIDGVRQVNVLFGHSVLDAVRLHVSPFGWATMGD
jgi:hypothetical protein